MDWPVKDVIDPLYSIKNLNFSFHYLYMHTNIRCAKKYQRPSGQIVTRVRINKTCLQQWRPNQESLADDVCWHYSHKQTVKVKGGYPSQALINCETDHCLSLFFSLPVHRNIELMTALLTLHPPSLPYRLITLLLHTERRSVIPLEALSVGMRWYKWRINPFFEGPRQAPIFNHVPVSVEQPPPLYSCYHKHAVYPYWSPFQKLILDPV